MIPYWILLSIPAWLSFSSRQPIVYKEQQWSDYWKLMFCFLVMMIGWRHNVGADWFSYLIHIENAADTNIIRIIVASDPAYEMLNLLSSRYNLDVYFVNIVSAIFFSWGLIAFCRRQTRPWLALTVAIPYLVIVVAMGYTRQGAAIGLAMLGLVALSEQKISRFILYIAFAATFHKSAVILMPLAALSFSKNRVLTLVLVGVFSLLLYLLFLNTAMESLRRNYLEAEYQSSGAAIRVFMNAFPALLFLFFRNRFRLSPADKTFWTRVSWIALFFVVLLKLSPSSTAVDRVALYLIPLQLFVLSRLPEVFGRSSGKGNDFWIFVVVLYCVLVQFIWLTFADHAFAWLPYQFYPLVWLMQ